MSEEEISAGKSSSKMLLVAGLIVGVAVGGGVTYFLAGAQPAPSEQQAVEEKKTEAPKELLDVTFDRLAVPIYDRHNGKNRFLGNYFTELVVFVEDESDREKVILSVPELRHSFIDEISKHNIMQDDNPVLIDNLKAQKVLKKRADQVIGAGVIVKILIVNTVRVSG